MTGEARGPSLESVERAAPWLILGYGALRLFWRAAMPGAVSLDSGEQFVAAQALAWGYGPNPPLYTWIQIALFAVLGEGRLAAALLREIAVAGVMLGAWALGRRFAGPRGGLLAACLALIIPQIGWEAPRTLTHTPLATALALGVLWLALRLGERRETWAYAALGLALGAGALAKPNFVLAAAGVGVAAVATARGRRALADRRLLATVGLALAMVAGPAWWMIEHASLAAARADKLYRGDGDALVGVVELGFVSAVFLAPPLVVTLFVTGARRAAWAAPGEARFVLAAAAAGLAAAALAVAAAGVESVAEHWVQPLLAGAAPVLAAVAAGAPRARALLVARGAGAVALIMAALFPVVHWLGGGSKPGLAAYPFEAVAAELGPVGTILAQERFLGGNLRLHRPDAAVLIPEMAALEVPARGPALLAWTAPEPPPDLLTLARARLGPGAPGPARRVAAPFRAPHASTYAITVAPWRAGDPG